MFELNCINCSGFCRKKINVNYFLQRLKKQGCKELVFTCKIFEKIIVQNNINFKTMNNKNIVSLIDLKLNTKEIRLKSKKIIFEKEKKEVGRLYLYILNNDLHRRPFAFIEDVFVKEEWRGKSIGSRLVDEAIKQAKVANCYKIIMTSRYVKPKVHSLYQRIGFNDHGKEFRMDLN